MPATRHERPASPKVTRNEAVRALLRHRFPAAAMRVRIGVGSAAAVTWTDGPSLDAVEAALAPLVARPDWRWAVTLDRRVTLRFVAAACARSHLQGGRFYRERTPLVGPHPWPLPAPHAVGAERVCVETRTGEDQLTDEHWYAADVVLALTGGDGATSDPARVSWEAMTVAVVLHHHWVTVAAALSR